jgi:triosephosphate isomerase (TIM)
MTEPPARLPLIVGNWKMHQLPSQSEAYASSLRIALESNREALGLQVEVALAPPYSGLDALGRALSGSGVALAAQNVHGELAGAFTGEVSVSMLEDLGCQYALIGHSERRQIFRETNAEVAAKAARLLVSGVDPILCLGETLEERERDATLDIVGSQLTAVLDLADESYGDGLRRRLVVAYEPVWAIGTGRTATPEIAQRVHASIRETLIERLGESGRQTRILYGGSVKPSNTRELLAQPDVDGALVGGASLEPETFAEIVLSALPSALPSE